MVALARLPGCRLAGLAGWWLLASRLAGWLVFGYPSGWAYVVVHIELSDDLREAQQPEQLEAEHQPAIENEANDFKRDGGDHIHWEGALEVCLLNDVLVKHELCVGVGGWEGEGVGVGGEE